VSAPICNRCGKVQATCANMGLTPVCTCGVCIECGDWAEALYSRQLLAQPTVCLRCISTPDSLEGADG